MVCVGVETQLPGQAALGTKGVDDLGAKWNFLYKDINLKRYFGRKAADKHLVI